MARVNLNDRSVPVSGINLTAEFEAALGPVAIDPARVVGHLVEKRPQGGGTEFVVAVGVALRVGLDGSGAAGVGLVPNDGATHVVSGFIEQQ